MHTEDDPASHRRRWLAAHRQAGLWAGICGAPLLSAGAPIFWAFDAPAQLLLAAVPAWLVHRRCSGTVLAMAGTSAASGIWLLLDAAGWSWLIRGLMVFSIRNGLWFGQPSLSRQWQATASNLTLGILVFLGVGALVGLLQACWGRAGSWRIHWLLASALASASGFALLFGCWWLVLLLLRSCNLSLPASPLVHLYLGGLLLLSSWLYWCLRGLITERLVISQLPACR